MPHFFQHPRALLATLALGATLGLAAPAQAAVPATERAVLVNLYNSTNGPTGWTTRTNWGTGDPCDNNWHGITCNATKDHVTGINLFDNQLAGPLPSSLSGLTALRYFSVYDNQLTGSIPSLDGLTALQFFSVLDNQLTGSIPSLAGLTALRFFIVGNNQLTGSIPSLSGLTALIGFGAFDNQLTGSIPSLSGLTALERFHVQRNQLTGPIPSLSGLTALQTFWVSHNQLTGTPPGVPFHVSLDTGGSALCPNFLHTPSPTDAAWNAATLGATWSTGCTPGYLVSTSAGAGGRIDPSRAVVAGESTEVAVTPDATHEIDTMTSTCTGAFSGDISGGSWTTGAVNADCAVNATFKAKAVAPAAVTPVPTLGEWALMLLAGLLAGLGLRRLPRQRA